MTQPIRTLPYRPGLRAVHFHDEDESCSLDCYYQLSAWTRIKAWFTRL